MPSIVYLFNDNAIKYKIKNKLVEFLKRFDAVKYNAEHTVSIEGWDVLTFIDISTDSFNDVMVENAPYEHIKMINIDYPAFDVAQIVMQNYMNYAMYDLGFDLDLITDEILLNLLMGTSHNYNDIYFGKTKLIDDVFISGDHLNRLVELSEEETIPYSRIRG